jgi:hypothetical protein
MANTVQDAYRIVFNDMMNSGCGLLVGKYDAKNGNEKYMFGVDTVMEWIAYKVSEVQGDDFSELFTKNMVESQKKARGDK